MKRFWLILLSLGLVMAFSASALAVDVKFSGEYYAAGMYLDKTSLQKDTATAGPSTAFYFQRLRVKGEFIVSPGLSFIARADIMERAWGAARSAPGVAADSNSMGTPAENENIAFDWAYLNYASPIGVFGVGYMINGMWGTMFGNSENQLPKLSYILPIGPFTIIAQMAKAVDSSVTFKNPISATNTGYADADYELYYLMGLYNWKGGVGGLGLFWVQNKSARPATGVAAQYLMIEPYMQATFGPVYVEAEVDYLTGKLVKTDSGNGEVTIGSLNAYVSAVATFGPVYFGGTFAYLAGDDPATTDKMEGGFGGGTEWNPCLLMFNYDRYRWAGAMAGYGTATNQNSGMANAFFYQGKVGVKPTAQLDIMGSVSYANADRKPAGITSDSYGWEVDVTGTYKITNNLSYMLGFGYFAPGDYYKGGTSGNLTNNYIVVNKLTLTF